MREGDEESKTYRNAVRVFLSDTLCLCLALLEWMLVFELGAHFRIDILLWF